MAKVNLKVYQNKARLYVPVPGTVNIHRVLVWNKSKGEYLPPQRGKLYLARRREVDQLGNKERTSMYFNTLEEARNWQSHCTAPAVANTVATAKLDCMKFCDVVEEWKQRKYPSLSRGTRLHYDQLIGLHFQALMPLPITTISPRDIDFWLADRKETTGQSWQSKTRKSFDHELTLLTVILRYYGEYHDEDTVYRLPIKARHRQDAKLNVDLPESSKELTESEFLLFRKELMDRVHGRMLAALATVQFYEALRISEAAALHWEDIRLDWKNPQQSRILVKRHIVFSRRTDVESVILPGFKNSKRTGGTKELPLFPPAFDALKTLYAIGKKGLIFHNEDGRFFEYSLIRKAFTSAFKRAGLPYTATHVMRHGGARKILDETSGDFTITGQLLGNTDMETIGTYAKRHKGALTKVAQEQWMKRESASELVANGRISTDKEIIS